MRKRKITPKKETPSLSRATLTLYTIGMLMIAIPLFYIVLQLSTHVSLSAPQVKYYATALEHVLAGLTLLTGGCYLVERVVRTAKRK